MRWLVDLVIPFGRSEREEQLVHGHSSVRSVRNRQGNTGRRVDVNPVIGPLPKNTVEQDVLVTVIARSTSPKTQPPKTGLKISVQPGLNESVLSVMAESSVDTVVPTTTVGSWPYSTKHNDQYIGVNHMDVAGQEHPYRTEGYLEETPSS